MTENKTVDKSAWVLTKNGETTVAKATVADKDDATVGYHENGVQCACLACGSVVCFMLTAKLRKQWALGTYDPNMNVSTPELETQSNQ